MLSAVEVSVLHGARTVLAGVSLSVAPGQRVGVVGPNGIGKTTLLRVLAGEVRPDSGRVERAPAALSVGLLAQETDALAGETVDAYLTRRTGVAAATALLDSAAEQLAKAQPGDDAAADVYAGALDRFLALGGGDLDARIGTALARVGLGADRRAVRVVDLSGGQQARAALAAILLSRFDVLLLDEPTNDLDFDGLDELESFVRSTPAGVVTVSHDRAFLDRCVDRIVEIREHHHDAVEYAGGWSDYVAARELARSQQYDAFERHQAQRRRLVTRAQTQRQWSERGARAVKRSGERDKFIRHHRTQRSEQQAAKAKMTERALERHDARAVDKPWEGWDLHLELDAAHRSGDIVVRLEGAVVERGSFRLGPVDWTLHWQDRVGVLGPNGSGKTTFLRLLLGTLPLTAGRRSIGPSVVLGTLSQARDDADAHERLVDQVLAGTGVTPAAARSQLAKFGLSADDVERAPAELSPGERTRAQLATIVLRGVNCLVLDEPTNHLDLPAIEQLEHALAGYDGTLVVVSHDRRFLDALALTTAVHVSDLRR